MTVVMLAGITTIPVYAADSVDYSAQLQELKSLMDQCAEKGIPTDYEQVSYSTIERFEEYINADLEKGIDASYTNYEKASVDAIYAEAKANLEAYLAGTKEPVQIVRPDMQNLTIDGNNIYYGKNPVFSIGYGFFGHAQADIPNFQSFGVNNIQMEIGPHQTWGQGSNGWNLYESKPGECGSIGIDSTVARTGSKSLHINETHATEGGYYVAAQREIPCKPDTTYTMGVWAKGTATNTWCLWMKFGWDVDASQRTNFDLSSSDWKNYTNTYRTGANQTTMTLLVVADEPTDAYLDDFYVYEDGSNVNLLSNPGFETDVYPEVEALKVHLNNAENNNVGVSLLLAPHYLQNIAAANDIPLTSDDQATFIRFDINHAKAKEIIEAHIRAVLSNVQDYDCIDSICISNEPWFDTRWFNDYQDDFRNYILEKHGDIGTIRDLYGMWSWQDIDDVDMPETNWLGNYKINAKSYDWMEFNDKVFTEWHEWMAGIVREYFPNTPIHSKVMENIIYSGETKERVELARGTDYEMFGEFSGYSGIDGSNFETNDYYELMFLYDYLDSAVGKPVYNSETHIIKDYNGNANNLTPLNSDETKKALTKMWQGAIHGRDLSTVWAWQRHYNDDQNNSAFFGGILFRPDLVDGLGQMNLDFARLSDEIVELQTNSNKVAIFYSKPSRLWTTSHITNVLDVYKELIKNGYDVEVVTEKSVANLSQYKTLIIPKGTPNTTQQALTAIQNFAANGGRVLRGDSSVLTKNEYNESMSVNISSVATYSLAALGAGKVTLKDTSTGAAPTDVEWQYSVTGDRILVNAVNMSSTAKTVDVYYNGTKIGNMKELISNQSGVESVALASYVPQLLEYKLNAVGETEIEDLTFDAVRKTLNWSACGEDFAKVNIYKYNEDNTLTLAYSTTGDEYVYANSGTYIVCPVLKNGTELTGKVITTVDPDDATKISNLTVNGRRTQVKINNLTEHYFRGNVVVELFDANGNVIAYGSGKAFIAPNGTQQLDVALSGKGIADHVKVTVYDDMDNCLSEKTADITY